MFALLGLGLAAHSKPRGEAAVRLTTISIDDFSRDRTLFDSGAAFGRDAAELTLSGTGTVGEAVEMRMLQDGGGASDWTVFAAIDEGGNWSGTTSVARHSDWLRFEVRIQSEPVTRAATGNRFGVGHVVALWGQSEIVRIRSTAYNVLQPEPLLSDDAVQVMWYDGGPVLKHLSNADPHTAATAAMANVFMAERPGDKFALVFQAQSGTGFRDLVDDSDPRRLWADDAVVHAFATADGQHVGMPSISWFATPGSLAEHYGEAVFPLFTGKTLDGTPVAFPTSLDFGTNSYQADHWFGEFYDPAHTKWIGFGPHRFDIDADMQSATVLASGGVQSNLLNKEKARQSWREMMVNPNADGLFLPLGLEPLAYQNGVAEGESWTDQSHPSPDTDDGAPMFGRLVAHAVLQSAGLTNWAVPVFDQSFWEPSGLYVEAWSSGGPITTPRLARGEAALDNSHPHWTDVFGWQINGAPAERAEIVAGRVRLFPNAGVFTSNDVIRFGEGGASGMVAFPDDHIAQTYKNLPVVDLGLSGIDGVSVRPLPDPAVLENTLVAEAGEFVLGATGPFFYDPVTLGAGVAKMQAQFDMAPVVPGSGTKTLLTTTGNYLRFEILPNGKLRLRVRDSGGEVHVDNVQTSAGLLTSGVFADIRFALDLQAGFARLWVNDALVMDEGFTSSAPTLPSNRILGLMATNTGAYQVEGTVSRIAIWKDATATGELPNGAPYKAFVGPASVVNGDAWKLGSDAT